MSKYGIRRADANYNHVNTTPEVTYEYSETPRKINQDIRKTVFEGLKMDKKEKIRLRES